MERLITALPGDAPPTLVATIQSTLADVQTAISPFRRHRDKRIAHTDLDHRVDSSSLPGFSWHAVEDALERIRAFMNAIMEHRPTEKIIRKRYASAFKGTNFHELLASLSVDTLIVTGISTSHCVYATCRDATDSFRVIVPKEAVGERCEIMHEVNLLDIDIDLGDVMPTSDVIAHLEETKQAS